MYVASPVHDGSSLVTSVYLQCECNKPENARPFSNVSSAVQFRPALDTLSQYTIHLNVPKPKQ